ncbi:winged helix-turn-helix transcriptional regulator [Halogeometricum sp. S1BR25-6]|uniref:Winged helix-turn-helix transcriptional regulator n=1 Tax=Halogeometricum salsisoli TaxID=2950536 RepID=A0ABU2GFW7_9EURY|nr:winged helix-turn-helix transcriptional regulator [Halogeometricum sp. S1BR25-6]MDS0299688.1 winged helix-turn-helix transcriptional regulator [Halogeometricum sp. S1BR25-6]
MSSNLGVGNGESSVPRAMIHKKILDAAESQPSASVEQVAAAVNGASADLVERVFEEYGDPAESEGTTGGSDHDATEERAQMDRAETNGDASEVDRQGADEPNDPPTLTMKQREALRAIRVSPEATQSELAEQFGVTQSTINNRLNTIEGFDWKRRRAFAEAALGDETGPEGEAARERTDGAGAGSGNGVGDEGGNAERTDGDVAMDPSVDGTGATETEARGAEREPDDGVESDAGSEAVDDLDPRREVLTRLDDLAAQVAALERRLDDAPSAGGRDGESSVFDEPDLACKVVRACFDAPDITETEEDRILRAVIASGGRA